MSTLTSEITLLSHSQSKPRIQFWPHFTTLPWKRNCRKGVEEPALWKRKMYQLGGDAYAKSEKSTIFPANSWRATYSSASKPCLSADILLRMNYHITLAEVSMLLTQTHKLSNHKHLQLLLKPAAVSFIQRRIVLLEEEEELRQWTGKKMKMMMSLVLGPSTVRFYKGFRQRWF